MSDYLIGEQDIYELICDFEHMIYEKLERKRLHDEDEEYDQEEPPDPPTKTNQSPAITDDSDF